MGELQSARKRGVVAGASVAALVGALLAWRFLAPETAPQFLHAVFPTKPESAPAQRALVSVQASINNPQKPAHRPHESGDHSLPSALNFSSKDDFRPSAHWFNGAQRSADGKFVPANTPLRFDESCRDKKEAQHTSFETAIAREVEFDPSQATPSDVQVQEIAQFWWLGDQFYKLAGTWERDQPATFRIKLYAATSADFEQNLRVMPLPEGLAARSDVLTLGEIMDRESDRAVAQGGTRGARFVQVFYPNASGQASEVKLHNGRPVSWVFGHGRCQLREQGDAYCRCIDAHEHSHHNHSHDQQSAGQPATKPKETPYRVHD